MSIGTASTGTNGTAAIRTAEDILRLGNAFCQAQALLTAAELDLFSLLKDGPATEAEIRERAGLDGRGLPDLLRLLAALGLLVQAGGRFANTPAAQQYLVAGEPGYVGGFLRGAKTNLYPVFDGLAETLRTGKPRSAGDDFGAMLADPDALRRYARMMDGVLQPLLPSLLAGFDWSAYGTVLDVGGCAGALIGSIVRANPGVTGLLFDLPQLEPVFDERMAELGTTGRVVFRGGDFFADPLPAADVVVFGHVLHNWRPAQRELLVRKAFEALSPGGVLVVHDRMLDEQPQPDQLVASLIMVLVTEDGSEYPVGELAGYARAAGFASVASSPLDENETLVLCHKA